MNILLIARKTESTSGSFQVGKVLCEKQTKGRWLMKEEKHYRHELKYEVSYTDYLAVANGIRKVMRPDPHAGEDGRYTIRSVYFDNSDDKALREKIDSISKREKFRIRYYNDDLSFITLEKKMKINDLCLKCDAVISREEYEKILGGDTDFMKKHENGLVRELYAKMAYQLLRPRVIVSYVREPYIYPPGNVRVTFDSKIRTTLFSKDFLAEDLPDISARRCSRPGAPDRTWQQARK